MGSERTTPIGGRLARATVLFIASASTVAMLSGCSTATKTKSEAGSAMSSAAGQTSATAAAPATGPGSLDATFGAGTDDGTPAGMVVTSLGDGDDTVEGLAVGADGKVVVVGSHNNGKSSDIALVRYLPDGQLDKTFGVGTTDGTPDGVVDFSLGDGNDFGEAVVAQPDGKLVVAGYHEDGKSTNIAVLRINVDGTLDKTFGTAKDGSEDGVVNVSLGDGNEAARDLAIQPDGKIVIVGDTVESNGSTNLLVGRLNADGSVDTAFGKGNEDGTPDGFVSTSFGDGDDKANAVVLQSNGDILVAGSHTDKDKSKNIVVARYDAAGALDPKFGASTDDGTPAGVVSVSLGDGDDEARDIAVQGDGRIVITGDTVGSDKTNNIAVARLSVDGSMDKTFGAGTTDGTPDGVAATSLGSGNDFATAIAVQADGKIVVGGYHQDGDSTNIAVARYATDGTLDSTFGKSDDGTPDGIVNLSVGKGDDEANAVAVQGGKLIVSGTSTATDGSKNIVVARLNAN